MNRVIFLALSACWPHRSGGLHVGPAGATRPQVGLVMFDQNYMDLFDCFVRYYANTSHVPATTLDVVVYDDAAHQHAQAVLESYPGVVRRLQLAKLPLDTPKAASLVVRSRSRAAKRWSSLTYQSFFWTVIQERLARGEDVLHMDLDAIPVGNAWAPVAGIDPSADIVAPLRQTWEPNQMYILYRSTSATRAVVDHFAGIWGRWRRMIPRGLTHPPRAPNTPAEQQALARYLKEYNPGDCERAGDSMTCKLDTGHLKWVYVLPQVQHFHCHCEFPDECKRMNVAVCHSRQTIHQYCAAHEILEAPIQRMRNAAVLTKNLLVLTRKPSKKKLEAQRKSARYRGLESRLEALPEAERSLLCDVFHLHDLDSDGQLSKDEVRHALGELGLQGVNAYERRELAQICADRYAQGTCDVCEFSADLVPTARRALLKIRRGRLQEGLSTCQRNWEGHYRLEEVFEAAKPCLPIELYEESETEPQWFEEVMEELKRHTQAFVFNDNVLALTSELMAISEGVQRRVCVKRRQVQQSYGLDWHIFQKFQSELVPLERLFRRLDADSSGYLEPDEVINVLMELGVVPKSSIEQRRITEMLEGLGDPSGASDFPSFLQIVEQVRQISESHADDGWHRAFQGCLFGSSPENRGRSKRFSVDSFGSLKPTSNLHEAFQGSLERAISDKGRASAEVPEEHTITVQQLRRILEDFGIVPADPACPRKRDSGIAEYELDPLELVLRDADPKGREEFNFGTTKRVGLRTKEIYRQRAFQYEAKKISDCNFSREELEDLKRAFNSFDLDGSGTLSEKEILKLMNAIGVKFPREVLFRITFCELDTDGGGMLEFSEFVLFAKMHRDKEGPLKPEVSPVTTLEALERSDLLALLDCLGIQFQAAVAALGHADLVRRASDKLSVDPAASLSSAIGVNTFGELLNMAFDQTGRGGPSVTSKTRVRG